MTMVILWLLMFKSVGFSKFFVKVIEVNFQLPANIANVIKGKRNHFAINYPSLAKDRVTVTLKNMVGEDGYLSQN